MKLTLSGGVPHHASLVALWRDDRLFQDSTTRSGSERHSLWERHCQATDPQDAFKLRRLKRHKSWKQVWLQSRCHNCEDAHIRCSRMGRQARQWCQGPYWPAPSSAAAPFGGTIGPSLPGALTHDTQLTLPRSTCASLARRWPRAAQRRTSPRRAVPSCCRASSAPTDPPGAPSHSLAAAHLARSWSACGR